MLAQWRKQARDIGPLAPRLLKIVTRVLENDLMLLRSARNAMYRINSGYFWTAKAPAFLAVAFKVIETNPDSAARLLHAARFLWDGLHEYDHAIDALFATDARGKLAENGRWILVTWLHKRGRWKESLPLLDTLLAKQPDRLDYVLARIRALHKSGSNNDVRTRFDAAEERMKELKRWNEGTLAAFAQLASDCFFVKRAVRYYEELIPLHQRTQPNRGVGRGTLSHYYGIVSRNYLALGQVDKAVDAASAAVVSWGRTHRNRRKAIASLLNVIAGRKDLDAYVKRYEARVAETGLDAPLIRKSIGAAYLGRRKPASAIPHLLAARELQPNDAEVHQQLLKAYDAKGESEKAIGALREGISMAPFNLDLYADLGTRLEKGGDATEAERAWTTLVEVLPNEAASHRRLATHRTAQNKHSAAVAHWRRVVDIRTDEWAGWIELARAQIKSKNKEGAAKTLRHILATNWANGNKAAHQQAEAMLRKLN